MTIQGRGSSGGRGLNAPNRGQGYVSELDYIYGFHRELNPRTQAFALALAGIDAPAPQGAALCELGYGQGITLNIHAAAQPGTRWWGTDFNPVQAASAQALANAAGSSAQLSADSFAAYLKRTDLPQFDYVALHGVWSWVSAENRTLITSFLNRHLKPGGVAFVSYNCLPGMASMLPLRQLLVTHAKLVAQQSAPLRQRITDSLAFARRLFAAGAVFPVENPLAARHLEGLSDQDVAYLAHEYFNADWTPMYVSEAAGQLAAAGLDYVTSANPFESLVEPHLCADGQAMLAEAGAPMVREMLWDYLTSRLFRRDLYVRGARRLEGAARAERLAATRFGLMRRPAQVPRRIRGHAAELVVPATVADPLLQALAAEAHRPKPLTELEGLTGLPLDLILEALMAWVGTNFVAVTPEPSAARAATQSCRALTDRLLDMAVEGRPIGALPSPVLGTGLWVDFTELLFLAARRQSPDPIVWGRQAWTSLRAQGRTLLRSGTPIPDTEGEAELTHLALAFAQDRLPLLLALEVVG